MNETNKLNEKYFLTEKTGNIPFQCLVTKNWENKKPLKTQQTD